MFFNQNGIKLQIDSKKDNKKPPNTWKLNNHGQRESFKWKNFFKVCTAWKWKYNIKICGMTVLSTLHAYQKRRSQISDLSLHCKELKTKLALSKQAVGNNTKQSKTQQN